MLCHNCFVLLLDVNFLLFLTYELNFTKSMLICKKKFVLYSASSATTGDSSICSIRIRETVLYINKQSFDPTSLDEQTTYLGGRQSYYARPHS